MSARTARRTLVHNSGRPFGAAGTAGPAVVAMGTGRRSARVASLVAWVLGTEQITDVRRHRATRDLARVQVPECLMARPDVVLVFAPNDAAVLPPVLCRLVREGRNIVVVSEAGGDDAVAAARSVGAALVIEREVVKNRGGCAHQWQRDRVVASAIIAALRDDWPPRRLMPMR